MTWNDAITDALIAQASRSDLKSGAANLNTIAVLSAAFGGILACTAAGLIELDDGNGKDIDPNIYFGIYGFLISILLVASIFLNRTLEPEIIEIQRS
jgi:preprotein translocase subunit Sec61beta